MPTRDVAEVLLPYGLLPPDLEMLRPTEASYTSLLMQPTSPIYASQQRIGTLDATIAATKSKAFLTLARERGAHLAVTPEYFLPWSALRESITEGVMPADDALWVLGSESIAQETLEQFKQDVAAHCVVIHEPWQGMVMDRDLLDPVVLLFQAKRQDGTSQLVALVQFKTFPSRDALFLEERWLRRGTQVYRFRGRSGHLTAGVIICSDAFAMDDVWLADFNDRATLIHIQLNPSPRNTIYRRYRTTTFNTDARASNCHIVCLNWAHSIVQHGDLETPPEAWNNIAASTWYCPADDCSYDDAVVMPNHKLGLYYAYMTERRHALLFHYDEAVFELRVPKLLTVGSAVMSNRNGPVALQRYAWGLDATEWSVEAAPETGFDAFVAANPHVQTALQHIIAAQDPLAVERVLALSAGQITGRLTWHALKDIDSCKIGPDEIVRRITVAQDCEGHTFRHERLSTAAQIHHEILTAAYWPPQVAGVDAASTILWDSVNPNFNVLTTGNQPTLIVYLGDLPQPRELETIADKLYELLRQAGGPHQKRFCIMYREFGELKFAGISALTRFDDPSEDKTEFLAVAPLDDTETTYG
jgi:predicted amidohydrolase